jgi:hypothetical protein
MVRRCREGIRYFLTKEEEVVYGCAVEEQEDFMLLWGEDHYSLFHSILF